MVKIKKISVLEEMKITTDGIYCIYPFSGFDSNNKGIFKIGITSKKFHERLDSHYHTYFPAGFYYCCFLQQPEKPEDDERTLLKFYGEIEQYIFTNIKNSTRVSCEARQNRKSEWFYTNQTEIFKVFGLARKKYLGKLKKYKITNQVFELENNKEILTTMHINFQK